MVRQAKLNSNLRNERSSRYKQVSRNASEPLSLRLVISKTPCGQRVIKREAEKMCRSRFAARKAWRGREGRNRRASGARDLSEPSRSESEAERVWKAALGTWEVCGAKASAEVGRGHSSVEAGQCPWVSPYQEFLITRAKQAAPALICRHIWNSICGSAAMLPGRVFVHKSPVAPRRVLPKFHRSNWGGFVV